MTSSNFDYIQLMSKLSPYKTHARPKIVCLCGSTKYSQAFAKANEEETLLGNIVLSVGFFMHNRKDYPITEETKTALDSLHFRKIDLADEVLILNVGGYIGESTLNEIAYAFMKAKPIRYLNPTLFVFSNPHHFASTLVDPEHIVSVQYFENQEIALN